VAGRTVRLDAPAGRVVSMIPAVTEWVVAIAGPERLVARTDYDVQPELAHLPSVGGGLTPSIEWLAARRPDLVVAWPDAPSRSVVGRLDAVGVPVYTAAAETIDEALATADDLGVLLGADDAARRAIAGVRHGLDSVRDAVSARPAPIVLYLVGLDPLMAAGPGTFVDELLSIAGGRNALADIGIRWPQVALEDVVARAPDVVIVGSAAAGDPSRDLRDRPGWRDVPAVRQGRVHAVDPDMVNRWGPRLHEAAGRLAELIHAPGTGGP
jgi:iron complex transport system substrate-binding protein